MCDPVKKSTLERLLSSLEETASVAHALADEIRQRADDIFGFEPSDNAVESPAETPENALRPIHFVPEAKTRIGAIDSALIKMRRQVERFGK